MTFHRSLIVSLPLIATALVACTTSVVDDDDIELESSALANRTGGTGAGLTAAECTGCGCTLVLIEKTEQCRKYKCVCETESQAKCAGSKAATITVPNGPIKVIGGAFTGAVLAR